MEENASSCKELEGFKSQQTCSHSYKMGLLCSRIDKNILMKNKKIKLF